MKIEKTTINTLTAVLLSMSLGIAGCSVFRPMPSTKQEAKVEAIEEYMEEADDADFEAETSEEVNTPYCDAVTVALRGYPEFSNILEDEGETDPNSPNITRYETNVSISGMQDYVSEFADLDERILTIRNTAIESKAQADVLYARILAELQTCVLFDPIQMETEDRSNGKLYEVLTVFTNAREPSPYVRLRVGKNFGFEGYYVILQVRKDK